MKLFTKYNRINLLFTVLIFITGSLAFSLLIHFLVNNQIDDDLRIEKNEVMAHIARYGNLPPVENVSDQYTSYKTIHSSQHPGQRFYTQEMWNEEEHEHESFRSVEWSVQVNQTWYLVTISESLDILEDLIRSIVIITIILIFLILIVSFVVNRMVVQRLWQPFYGSMQTVQNFQLHNAKQISLEHSSIDEFNLMNETLANALNKARNDYQTLKEFTENASHELQTPLAIISSKLDMMIQSEDLTEPQSKAINGVYEALKSMKRLNQSLLLLAKIENRQFAEQTNIDLQQMVADKQKQFAEQLQYKNISIQTDTTASFMSGNKQLIDILLNNLFSNAIKYNKENGIIELQLHAHRLEINNTSELPALQGEYIFTRFYKGNSEAVHHGLGLSIVKQICDVSGYTYRYEFRHPDIHSFAIGW